MSRLKQGDQVVVITGADRGKTGRILTIDRQKDQALVEGVNMKFKHMRRSQENPQGGRIQREYPMTLSNLAYFDAEAGKGVRLGIEVDDKGNKHRIMRPSGRRVDS